MIQDMVLGMQEQGRAEGTKREHNRVKDRSVGGAGWWAWQEGEAEWKALARAGNGMSGQGRARHDMARQGQRQIKRRAGEGRW